MAGATSQAAPPFAQQAAGHRHQDAAEHGDVGARNDDHVADTRGVEGIV